MHARLYTKILGWFLLNLLLLAVVVVIFLTTQFHFDLNGLLSGRAGSQVDAVGKLIEADLRRSGPGGWSDIVERYGSAYGVQIALYRPDGLPIVPLAEPLPAEVRQRLSVALPPPLPPPGQPGLAPEHRPGPRPGPFEKILVHTRNPTAYWAMLEIGLPADRGGRGTNPGILVVRSTTLNANGLFFDIRPWLILGAVLFVGSALFWLPFVRRITRSISGMTEATKKIADGNFDVKVDAGRRDELGSLADSINRMAGRLDGLVSGQKRFLGDIAHELCAPLSRIQMALGILEERNDPSEDALVADLREEADQMSSLVNELLAFSKASLGAQNVRLVPVEIRRVAERAVRRETADASAATVEIDPALRVIGDETLLERALANLIRNALRHSGGAGIVVSAASSGSGEVAVAVADSGPGVPEESIPRLFDPFFRPDVSRSRETGGTGLGLAIVRTCVELCGGRVSCRNRQPSGLEITLRLAAA